MPIQLSGSLAITGSMVATGQITAQTLVVQTITSSVSFITGSTKFGNSLTDTHQFTGSVGMIDNLNVNGTIGASSEILANNLAGVVFNRDTVGYVKLRGDNTGAGSLDGGDYVLKTGIAYYGDVVTDNYLTYGTLTGSFALLGAGIGAFTPEATLDVSGSTKIRGIARVTGSLIVSGSSTLINIGPAIFTGSITQNASTASFGGVVGIGTTTPNQLLEVAGGNGNNQLRISFNGDTRYYNDISNQWDGGTVANNLMTFKIATGTINTTTNVMTLVGNGNVGIGTTSPFAKLSIAADDALRLQGNNAYMSFFNGANNVRSGYLQINAAGVGTYLTDEVNGAINFSAGGSTRQIITAAGNVGIGTTSPTSLLHLKAASNPVIRLEGASDSGYVDYNGTRLILSAGAGYMGFVAGTAEYMRLDGSGNLGIGTTAPAYKLDVSGSLAGWFHTANNGSSTYTNLALGEFFGLPSTPSYLFQTTDNGGSGGLTFNALRWGSQFFFKRGSATGEKLAMALSSTTGQPTTLNLYHNDTDVTYISLNTGGNSYFNGGNVGIGTTSPSLKLDVSGSDALFNGVRVGRGVGNISSNTVVGAAALFSNTTGYNNVALGNGASGLNTTGYGNTAVGAFPLYANTTGYNNTAMGVQALTSNTTGYNNTALGLQSMFSNTTGYVNTAVGFSALYSNTTGIYNTGLGMNSGYYISTGTNNTVIGTNNNIKPDGATLTTQNGILSLSSANEPEIWAQNVQVEVPINSSATILSIDVNIYAGAVVDYSLQDDAGAQRTSTMLIAFDCSANVSYTDPNQIEQGGTGDYTFAPSSNAPLVDLVLTNSGTQKCVVVLSCRLLKRYYGCS